MTDDLLLANATALERELAALSARLDAIDPSVIETIWDAWRCPAALLPWLAWALSVDHWDEAWPEVTRRQAIADSPDYHRRKGTRAAVEQLLALPGLPVEITEWWERTPMGRRGTSMVHVAAPLAGIASYIRAVRPLVMTSKPKARPIYIGAGPRAEGAASIGAVIVTETLVTVDPYAFAAGQPEGVAVLSYGILAETLTTIEAAA